MTWRPDPLAGRPLRLPPAPGAVRRRTGWHRVWGLGAAVLGAAVLLFGAALLSDVPALVEDEQAFRAGTACTAASSPDDNCLRPIEMTVARTVIRNQGKSSEYTLYMKGPAPVPGSVDMGGPGPLLKRLSPGDRVTVTMWREYATEVRRGEVVQRTSDTPEGEPAFACAFALAGLSGGAYSLYAGVTALSRARRYAERGLPATLLTRGKESFGAALCAVPAMVVGAVTGITVMLVVWLALLPLVHPVVRRLEQRGPGRHRGPAYPA